MFLDNICSHDFLGDDAPNAAVKEKGPLPPSRLPIRLPLAFVPFVVFFLLMNLNVFLCRATPHGLTAWDGLTVQWGKRQGSATRPLRASLNAPQWERGKKCCDRVIGVQKILLYLPTFPSAQHTTPALRQKAHTSQLPKIKPTQLWVSLHAANKHLLISFAVVMLFSLPLFRPTVPLHS